MKLYLTNIAFCPLPSDLLIEDLRDEMLAASGVFKTLEEAKADVLSNIEDSNYGEDAGMGEWQQAETNNRSKVSPYWIITNGAEGEEEICAIIREIDI